MNESQFQASMVGMAVGDALGYPAEFRSRKRILNSFGPEGITDFVRLQDPRFELKFFSGTDHPPGTYTDDTQMAIAVAEALLDENSKDFESLMTIMGKNFVDWSVSENNDRAPGDTCMQGCENLAHGIHWRESGVTLSKGCGSAMRVAAIGLIYEDLDQVRQVARASSLPTHGHDAAIAGAEAAALMVALALKGSSPSEVYEFVDRCCSSSSNEFASTWRKVPDLLDKPPEYVLTEDVLGEAWDAEEAVASAMYCFWRHPDEFEKAILMGVNTDGDSDSIAAIAGSVLGARLGLESIPLHWRTDVENSDYLHNLGKRLWAGRQNASSGFSN